MRKLFLALAAMVFGWSSGAGATSLNTDFDPLSGLDFGGVEVGTDLLRAPGFADRIAAQVVPSLNYDLSDPSVIALNSGLGEYAATLNQPSADPTFTFSAGDVIHMSGSVTFNALFGGTTALLVFTSFREAPTVTCGTPPPPRLDASPGADVNTDPNIFQGSAIQSSPVGSACSTELDGQPFLAMVIDQVIPGQTRNFQFDLVLDGPMDGAAGMRAYYQGYRVIPEPSTALLLALGLAGLAARRRV